MAMLVVISKNQLTYEETLNWLGFAFETSRGIDQFDDYDRDGEYGIGEAWRIMNYPSVVQFEIGD